MSVKLNSGNIQPKALPVEPRSNPNPSLGTVSSPGTPVYVKSRDLVADVSDPDSPNFDPDDPNFDSNYVDRARGGGKAILS